MRRIREIKKLLADHKNSGDPQNYLDDSQVEDLQAELEELEYQEQEFADAARKEKSLRA